MWVGCASTHIASLWFWCFFFFFNDTATTEIYTLSLHDALPISPAEVNSAGGLGANDWTELPVGILAFKTGTGEGLYAWNGASWIAGSAGPKGDTGGAGKKGDKGDTGEEIGRASCRERV